MIKLFFLLSLMAENLLKCIVKQKVFEDVGVFNAFP
jgi:hypothetical protein